MRIFLGLGGALLGAFAMGAVAAVATAHAPALWPVVRYLWPSTFTPAPGAALPLSLSEGDDGAVAPPWPAAQTRRFFLRSVAGQENRDTLAVQADDSSRALTPPLPPGAALLALDLSESVGRLDLAQVRAHCPNRAAEGHASSTPSNGTVRVRQFTSCKTVVRTPGSQSGGQLVSARSGLHGDIRPLIDPSAMQVGGDLPVMLLAGGGPQENVELTVHAPDGSVRSVRSAPEGMANVSIDRAGVWRMAFQIALPARAGDAEWDLFTASLSFEVNEPAEVKP